jgi:carboxyl-terminal processing protease
MTIFSMKLRFFGLRIKPGYLLSYALVTAISCASSSKDDLTRERIVAQTLIGTLQNQHFTPQQIDDTFSKRAFEAYIKNLDVNKRFLLKEDIDVLRAQELTIDDDLREGNFRLMRLAESLLDKRTKQVAGFYEEILTKPFDFSQKETIEFDYDKRHFAVSIDELKEEWRKYEKYQAMVQVMQKMQAGRKNKLTPDSVKILLTPEIEAAARESVRKSNKDFFKRLSQVNESDRLSEFVNSLTHLYDPHTDYYAPANKENFDIQLSGKLEGIGATLNIKDGLITVANVVPGSAAWRQGQLKVNDQILKVAQDKDEPVDVTDMRIDDAIKLIRGKKGTRVVLTVRKPDASIVDIAIIRDVVILEDTFAKSTLLQPDGSKELVGYLNLPSFYVDFNRPDGRRCANDVRDELKKLKAAGAKSLVFDLRNNGGGSLPDVVRIAGFFIDKGPMVQVKSRSQGSNEMEDRDAGTLFDGPLVVMVNPFSASAS